MILVLDFGSQYTQLIARRIRESKVYCEIHPFNISLDKINALKPEGIILSGGPASVYQENAPNVDPKLFNSPVSFLGICYGMGILNLAFGGEAGRADRREYGPADLVVDDDTDLLQGFAKGDSTRVWMSHGDKMTAFPKGWNILAHSANSPIAAFADPTRRFFGVQGPARLDDGTFYRDFGAADPRKGRRGQGTLRPQRRGGFGRGCDADSPGNSRAVDLRVRQQRALAQERSGTGL
jgi:GMP synthase (glutamine-hydrolysing) A subunit